LAHFTNFGSGSFSGFAVKGAMCWNEFGDFLAVASDQNFFTCSANSKSSLNLFFAAKDPKRRK